MSDLYDKIDTANKFTVKPLPGAPPDADRTEQVSVALEMARRSGASVAPEPLKTMPPIMPVPN